MSAEEEDADLAFEREKPATAIVRKKHINILEEGVLAGIKEAIHRDSIFQIPKAEINPRFRKECRQFSFHSSWVKTSSCSLDYTPILIQNPHGDDFRMRSVGVIAGNGPSITVFDMELGKKLYEITEHTAVVHSVMISRPAAHLGVMPVIVTGSHHGYMKSWDLQSGTFMRSFGTRLRDAEKVEGLEQRGGGTERSKDLNVHKGPVKVVYVHDNTKSLAFSGSGTEVFVWTLEEGTLRRVMNDHTRPVSAICCYQHSQDDFRYDGTATDEEDEVGLARMKRSFDVVKHPPSMVSGGEDSCVFIYSLKTFALLHKLDNHAGPISAIDIPLAALNGTREKLPIITVACFDGSVQLWSLGTGLWLSSIALSHGPVTALCVLPTPTPGLITGHSDGSIIVSNLRTGKMLASLLKTSARTQTQTRLSFSQHLAPRGIGSGAGLVSKGGESLGLPNAVSTLSCIMAPRPMVLGGYQHPQVYVWDLNVGKTPEAVLLQDMLVKDLRWKDPLLAHNSDTEDEDEDDEEDVRGGAKVQPSASVSSQLPMEARDQKPNDEGEREWEGERVRRHHHHRHMQGISEGGVEKKERRNKSSRRDGSKRRSRSRKSHSRSSSENPTR